jgi:hypothetical protein
MKLPKEKSAAEAKRRLENPLTEAQKAEKAAVDAERLCKIKRTADRNSERLRAKAKIRSAVGVEGLAGEASRLSTRRKFHPLTNDEKAEKARLEAEKRSAAWAELLAAETIRKPTQRKTNPLTLEQKAMKAVASATVIKTSAHY